MSANTAGGDADLRLDKWLWAARFFKTRRQAVEAINGGKVQINGQRTKPGKAIQAGTHLVIHKGSLQWDLVVKGISRQRRPASEAALLYEESEASRLRRQAQVRERRESGAAAPGARGRPNKRERRLIQRFTRKADD
ncbi:RNA-binding S4 domain-containing protein [Candidatus Thiosymbion oneisti]|uniref:RNA-binding S4 domain-containing protein n=1 Tax=Candidatus Thiosymbion oneisti TaxID=589554 RepID=UPI000B116B48|nr:S4 domain-containing protein [Candidatus Thiosymbion oneisti]